MPLVSVILSTFNWNNTWLEEAIQSVLNQTCTDFEFIIINDASQNNIKNMILKYKNLDTRIIYIKNEINLWLTESLNKWIQLSKWKYIARIDDDDIWSDKNKIQKQINFMEGNPWYWICWTSTIIIDEYWNTTDRISHRSTDSKIRDHLSGSNQFTHSSIIINKKALLLSGWYINTMHTKLVEDYDLWMRIWRDYKMYNLSDFTTKYRINKNSLSNKKSLKQDYNALLIAIKNIRYFPSPLTGIIKHLIIIILPKKLLNKLIKNK